MNTEITKQPENKLEGRFTYEERQKILKSTGCRCAHCGKKITSAQMKVEHIIPRFYNGTDDPENLTALCEACNKAKGHMIYLPWSFYLALHDTARIDQMEKMVRKWFNENMKDRIDIEIYPLIAPEHYTYIAVSHNTRKHKVVPSLFLKWEYIGKDKRDEIEAITGINLRETRKLLTRKRRKEHEDFRTFDMQIEEVMDRIKGKSDDEIDREFEAYELEQKLIQEENERDTLPVAFYGFRKPSSSKLLALVAIRYDKTREDAVVYLLWSDTTNQNRYIILSHFIPCMFYTIESTAGYKIKDYLLLSNYPKSMDAIYRRIIHPAYIDSFAPVSLQDENGRLIEGMVIQKNKGAMPKYVSSYLDLPEWITIEQDAWMPPV